MLACATLAALALLGAGRSTSTFNAQVYPWGVTPPDVTRADVERASRPRGEQLYSVYCAVCHGLNGRGDGPAASFVVVPPADFTRAEFKVRSTVNGALPTDADLRDVIQRGAGGPGAMPSFSFLRSEDLDRVIAEVKGFSPRWAREPAPTAARLPPPARGAATRGERVYREWQCDTCHGPSGRGDGRIVATLRSSRGDAETPADLTQPWRFKAGGDAMALARSITTGFNGTSMAAFKSPAGKEFELWDLVAYLTSLQRPRPVQPVVTVDTSSLEGYWKRPVAARGDQLAAASCAACHPLQFTDWSRSRHAAAMSPGVWAQMHDEPKLAGMCSGCHAPLDLQRSDPYLAADGVGCSACHVRAHETFGPPPAPTTLLGLVSEYSAPHQGVNVKPYFEQTEFCASCHQFQQGEAPLVHGTVLQNTVEEWRASRAAKEGRTCQSCHMPDRRHFFRGIHDPDTVRAAVRWSFEVGPIGSRIVARMTLTNTGAGHLLPTYVVPEIWMRIELVDDHGSIRGSAERLIARKVAFVNGDWVESSDTRLRPDQTMTLEYEGSIPSGARTAVGRVVVLPDAWHVDSFSSRLPKTQSRQAARYYTASLDEIQRSGYTLFQLERALPRAK